jgi:hypothetical protein
MNRVRGVKLRGEVGCLERVFGVVAYREDNYAPFRWEFARERIVECHGNVFFWHFHRRGVMKPHPYLIRLE